jgi:PKD repeat protein
LAAVFKKFSWIMLAVLFVGLLVVQPLNRSEAPPLTKVSVDPPETKDPLLGVGSTFKVNITISDVLELFSYQVNMTYNPSVVNTTATSIVKGPFLDQAGPTVLLKKVVNNTAGYLAVSYTLWPLPEHGANGSGTLFSVTFKVKSLERGTLFQIKPYPITKLNTVIAGNSVPIEFETEDGVFDNRLGNAPPIASFSTEPTTANVTEAVQFDATASYDPDAWLVSYHWDFDDGTTQLFKREYLKDVNLTTKTTHTYSMAGTYTVNLTVTDNDGATASVTSEVVVKAYDIAITDLRSSHIAVMPGVQVSLEVTAANQGDYTGSFNVSAYYNESLIGTQQAIDLAPHVQTKLTFTWDTTGVAYGRYTLKANATIDEREANTTNNEFIDGNITIATMNIADYSIIVGGFTFHILVESNSTTSDQIQFNPLEKKINFTVQGEAGTEGFCTITIPIDFLGGPYTIWLDGLNITSEVQQTTNGTHVFLYFTYVQNTHDIEIVGQTVATPPVASFTVSTTHTIVGTSITFNATESYDPDGNYPLTYSWDFQDGSTATGETVEHTYTSHGNYNAILTVKDAKQLTGSAENMITIIDYPRAAFTYSPSIPLVSQPLTFNASSSEPEGGEIINYSWIFGDGTNGAGITCTHTYQEIGNYIVVLNVTDDEDLWDTETRTVTVSIHDIAIKDISVTPDSAQIGQQISIAAIIENKGNFTENTDLSAYYDSTLIETKPITDFAPADSRTITITWNTSLTSPDTYELKVMASTVTGETNTEDNTLTTTVTVTRKTSQLILEELLDTLTLGEEITMEGTISPALPGISVTIQHRLIDAQSWTTIGVATTDSGGHYTLTWKPEATGTYEVKAAWIGDASTMPSESDPRQITVEEPPAQINMYYLAGAVIIIILVVVAVYFLKIRKR